MSIIEYNLKFPNIYIEKSICNKFKALSGTYNLRDVTSMARELNTLPIYMDLDREYSPEGGPVGGQTKFDLPNNHLLYAIHWFALSAIFTFILIRYSKNLK